MKYFINSLLLNTQGVCPLVSGVRSLRNKRFRFVSERRDSEERDFRAGFDSRSSFFAPKAAHAEETLTTCLEISTGFNYL